MFLSWLPPALLVTYHSKYFAFIRLMRRWIRQIRALELSGEKNRLFMLILPAHLQLNHGKSLDPTNRDVLRAQIIRSALNQDTPQKS